MHGLSEAGHDRAVHGRTGLGYMFSKGVKYMFSGSGVGVGWVRLG